jgi:lipopolysaccharide/colanic/teichoic acid biosynthesis glycosyltransferase
MAVVALGVKLTSGGPVFFRQRRPGKNGSEFSIVKFRTMVDSKHISGPVLTRACDPRVTSFGRHLRRWKIDELPQLFNVLAGDMSFVGPRPQPTKLWQQPSIQKQAVCVLSVRPGLTSQATLNFRNEEELLAPLSAEETEAVYMKHVMPLKLAMEIEYLRTATFLADFHLILKTALRIFHYQKDDLPIKASLPRALPPELSPEVDQETTRVAPSLARGWPPTTFPSRKETNPGSRSTGCETQKSKTDRK